MTFNKAAIDVISKGLDPRHPHKKLGRDGLLAVPEPSTPVSTVVEQQAVATTVVSVFSPLTPVVEAVIDEAPPSSPSPVAVVETVAAVEAEVEQTPPAPPTEDKKVEEVAPTEQTTKPVVPKTGRRSPPVRTPKVPHE